MRGKRRPLTPELSQTICTAIEAGNTRECAAQMAGVSPEWLYLECRRNADFAAAIARADALAEGHHVTVVQKAARRGNVQAAMFWLERRRPQMWGRTVKVDIEARVRVMAEQLGLDADEAVAVAERLLTRQRRALTG